MLQCEKCEGFIPNASPKCPNCLILTGPQAKNSKVYRQVKTAATVMTAGMISMTLMACYGAPPDYLERRDRDPVKPLVDEDSKPDTGEKEPEKATDR